MLTRWFLALRRRRDRLLSSAKFQHWAAAFPLTRPIAQRRARAVFDLVAGFVYSQVLFACVQLRLFDILFEAPQTVAQLSARLNLTPAATLRLLDAAVSLKLLEKRGSDLYGLGSLGAPLVGNTAITSMIEHHAALYADLRDPVALLRGDVRSSALARYWPYAKAASAESSSALSTEQIKEYTALMSASQPLVAGEVLDAYPINQHHTLMDVGGGEGTFLLAAAQRAPDLKLMLFDLPPVAERAKVRFAEAGLSQRTTTFGGSFFSDALPEGADVISLVRVVHDHDDENVMTLLHAVRRALPDKGTLLLAEPMAGTKGAEPIGAAYFGFYLLAMGTGRARTATELEAMLRKAGFTRIQKIDTNLPLQTGLIIAQP